MMLSGRITDKVLFVAIYSIVVIVVVIYGGRRMTNYVLDVAFYNDYLVPWQMQLIAMRHQTAVWPPVDAQDPAGYMQKLLHAMAAVGLQPPRSNTAQSYLYRLNKFGEQPRQILIVGTSEKVIIYNLPESTFNRIDRLVDSKADAVGGSFTGILSKDGVSRIAYWRI